MIVATPTVEHSGTHFLADLLRSQGFRQSPPVEPIAGPDAAVHAHFGQKHWDALDRLIADRGLPVIIPVRPLHAIWLSWEARAKNTDLLGERIALMVEQIGREPYWLPIEAADRDDWLAEINDGLGLNIETRWPVVGSVLRTAGRPESRIEDQSGYRALRERYGWFFAQLYRA